MLAGKPAFQEMTLKVRAEGQLLPGWISRIRRLGQRFKDPLP